MVSRPATWVPWCWSNRRGGYEVEFMTLDGETVVVTSLEAVEVRPIAHHEVAHVRSIQDQPVGKAHGDSRGYALLKVKREQQSTNNSVFSFNMLFVCGRPDLSGGISVYRHDTQAHDKMRPNR
jgi:hypothetical protein